MPTEEEIKAEVKGMVDEATGVVKDALKGFLEDAEVQEFTRKQVESMAREYYFYHKASTDAEKEEAQTNLRHLRAQTRAEVHRLQIQLSVDAMNTLVRVLETIGGVFLRLLPVASKFLGAA